MSGEYRVTYPEKYALRETTLRRFTPLAEKGVDIKLYDASNSPQVYWSTQHNSYVVTDSPSGWWTAPDGTPCDLYSINGHGEVRWAVSSERGNTSGDLEAARYFGLTWHGYRDV